ncbi:uncharacterized protein ACB058_012045 [Synchiropus picturatus]
MLFIYCLFFFLPSGGCDRDILSSTVAAGQDVTIECNCQSKPGDLYWTLLTSDNLPKCLVSADSYGTRPFYKTPRITAERSPQHFDLHISRVELGDSGIYFCTEVWSSQMTFLNVTFLQVQDTQPPVIDVVQPDLPTSNLECSLFTNSRNKPCSDRESVYWFKSGADGSPSLLLAHDNRGAKCEPSSLTGSRKCYYTMSRDEKCSDNDKVYCAVVSCGHIFFGNGSEIRKKQGEKGGSYFQRAMEVALGAALAVSVGVNAVLTCIIRKQKRDLHTSSCLQTTSTCDEQQPDTSECLVYAVPSCSRRKSGRQESFGNMQENVIYSGVKVTR